MRIGEDEIKWNFIPLPINEFDVILGMDGLSRYRAKINCYERRVIFQVDSRREIYFIRERRSIPIKVVLEIMAMKYLRKGCEAYLVFIIDQAKKEVQLKEVLMVASLRMFF